MLTSTPLFRTPTAEEVSRHIPLVRRVVAGFMRRLPANVLREDLIGAGITGLVDSLRKNGGDHGPTFEAYARIRVRGAILDELRSQDWLPRRARWAVMGKHEPSASTAAPGPVGVVGLDDLSSAERAQHMVDDSVDDAPRLLEQHEHRARIAQVVDQLPPRERTIVRMHYFEDARFREISEALGVSEPRVSQLHTRAMARLRELLANEETLAA
jgi:RNA polymerase sigma factor for flagellar operon FliA